MSNLIERVDKEQLIVVPSRGIILYPGIPANIDVPPGKAANACEKANSESEPVFFLCQKNTDIAKDDPDNLYRVGTVAAIKQLVKNNDGSIRILLECLCRATVMDFVEKDDFTYADVLCKSVLLTDPEDLRAAALREEAIKTYEYVISIFPKVSAEQNNAVHSLRNPGMLADYLAAHLVVKYTNKQRILEEYDPLRRLELVILILEQEADIAREEINIQRKVKAQLESNQREYYMREQLKVLKEELGEDEDNELEEYYEKIEKADLPQEVEERLIKEVKKLSKVPFSSAESGVMRNYLDTCLEIPWKKATHDRVDIEAAKKILDRDHDGLEKIKERILEFLAVRQLNPDIKNQILCLVGPPGVGKTSIGASIATAMKRKYVRVSLGGVRDEADIRGHRKTYIGSMPGRIINALVQAGVRNPLILLDEIDKLTHDAHGDPASALLEVLDSEQNKNFRDHFIEMPVDLSDCLFIATANTLDTVPRPLIDRMEIIELKIYTRHEKLAIAQNHLLPKQMKRHGLNKRMLKIDDGALMELIDFYTREAGVRNLEREIASLCRKGAKALLESGEKSLKITADDIAKYLGVRKILPDHIDEENEIGTVNGLAYTELGGDMLRIEAVAMPGSGKIELTGSLGEVMKESARIAVSYIRAHSAELKIANPEFYKEYDLHIHVPEGAVPKDGPSAGVTITTALVSLLSGRPVRRDVAMTGEVTLRGKVLAIGGLKEKTMAAYTTGVTTVCIPAENERDLEEIDPIVRQNLTFVPCKTINDVLNTALLPEGEAHEAES